MNSVTKRSALFETLRGLPGHSTQKPTSSLQPRRSYVNVPGTTPATLFSFAPQTLVTLLLSESHRHTVASGLHLSSPGPDPSFPRTPSAPWLGLSLFPGLSSNVLFSATHFLAMVLERRISDPLCFLLLLCALVFLDSPYSYLLPIFAYFLPPQLECKTLSGQQLFKILFK